MTEAPDYEAILVDDPAPQVHRITLNRPEKRNPLNDTLRGEIFAELARVDRDDEIRVTILRGAGKCFSAGYDLGGGQPSPNSPLPAVRNGLRKYMAPPFSIQPSKIVLALPFCECLSPRPVEQPEWRHCLCLLCL